MAVSGSGQGPLRCRQVAYEKIGGLERVMVQPAKPIEGALIWIDLEMTGLKTDSDRIIEIAMVVTDADLTILAQSDALAIRQPQSIMDAMDAWNRSTHGKSGLTERVLHSAIDEAQAERRMLDFVSPWVGPGLSPMCGNTICQDRRFLARLMPELEAFFHYRNLDVSTLKELARRWRPDLARGFQKRNAHTALADIQESIDELRYYRETFLRMQADNPAPSAGEPIEPTDTAGIGSA